MQRVTLVRYTTKPDRAAENEALSRAVFAQLRTAPPEGVAGVVGSTRGASGTMGAGLYWAIRVRI